MRVGHFPNHSAQQIASNILAQGLSGLDGIFSDVGPTLTVGSGVSASAGRIEDVVELSLASSNMAVYGVVYNSSVSANADEILIVRFPDRIEEDFATTLGGLTAVHFKDSAIVIGSRDPGGLQTVNPSSFVSGYDQWITTFPLSGTDLLSTSDPDSDKSNNLKEYALGSLPNDASSVDTLQISVDAGQSYVQFLQRTDDALLEYQIEISPDLSAGSWTIQSAETELVEQPGADYHVVHAAIPGGGVSFARIRVSYLPQF
jgi:hypothetical protein